KNFYKFMKYSMEQYEIWDYVNEEERTRESHTNIPYLLEKNSKINEKIVVFLNSILESVEKNKFYLRENKISEIIKSIVENWKRDYSKLDFQIKIEEDLIYEISEDIIKVILDNLILNSVQQNSEKTTLKIEIKIEVNSEGKLEIVYKDFGKGLDKKYLENPEKILEVHETSRDDGHGLGMWIINNSILMCSGEVKNIIGTDGFEIFFTLGRGV
ncbi:sensor histidine kinase, partial [Cetobacterium sp.]|uniref:sensor histidine kinase n=2 Tax=Cetobacterium sp. TaxID=2071632 RepID=UPI003EE7255B